MFTFAVMRKALDILLYTFLVFIVSALLVGHVLKGGTRLGESFSSFVETVVNIPETLRVVVAPEVMPEYIKVADFEVINKLDENIYALHTYQEENKAILLNLKNNEVIHEWTLPNVKTYTGHRYWAMLLPNMELIYYWSAGPVLTRLDSNSNIVWELEQGFGFHHSINSDGQGNLWVCGSTPDPNILIDTMRFTSSVGYLYGENFLIKVDIETGKLLYKKSLMELFLDEGINPLMEYHANSKYLGDVFHLNDIQPVRNNTEHMQQGDVLFSVRALNWIVHYRPGVDSIIKIWDKGISAQHDIDILNDSVFSVFNNNVPGDLSSKVEHLFVPMPYKPDMDPADKILAQNVWFDYEGNILEADINEQFREYEIFTTTEGLIEYLPSGKVFVEEQNDFIIWLFDEEGELLYKGYFNHYVGEGYMEIPNWTRIYEDLNIEL